MPSFLKSKKAQFFVLSAFAIVSIIYFVSKWMEPYTIIDTSYAASIEEPFIFNNIVEKTNETIYISKNSDDLQYNIQEYKNFVEGYASSKNLQIIFDTSKLSIGSPVTRGSIFIQISSPRMVINKTLSVLRLFQ